MILYYIVMNVSVVFFYSSILVKFCYDFTCISCASGKSYMTAYTDWLGVYRCISDMPAPCILSWFIWSHDMASHDMWCNFHLLVFAIYWKFSSWFTIVDIHQLLQTLTCNLWLLLTYYQEFFMIKYNIKQCKLHAKSISIGLKMDLGNILLK